MQGPFSTQEVAELYETDQWRVRRLFESGTLPEPKRFAGIRAIPNSLLPAIAEALKQRDWLGTKATKEPATGAV